MTQGTHKELTLTCQCGAEILAIWEFERWQEEPRQYFIEFYTMVGHKTLLKQKIKTCWNILRGKSHSLNAICFVDEDMIKLKTFLEEIYPNEKALEG